MRRLLHGGRAALPLLVVLGVVRLAEAVPCTVGNLCPIGPGACTVTAEVVCDSPATFDLGSRALVIAQGKSLRVTQGDGEGALSIVAGSVTLEANARIETTGNDTGSGVGRVVLATAGPVSLQSNSRIEASPGDGMLEITAGSMSLGPEAMIQVHDDEDESGTVIMTSAGPVSLAAGSRIDTSANFDGGLVLIDSDSGDIQALGFLKLTAGSSDGDGGEVGLSAFAGSVSVGGEGINASGGGGFGGGGSVDVFAAGDVALHAPVDVRGGDGGEVSVDADGSITSGAAASIEATATAAEGGAGSVDLFAGGDVVLGGTVTGTASGGGSGGGIFALTDTGSVEITAAINLAGSGEFGAGGRIDVISALDLTVSAAVVAAGGDFGGDIVMSAERLAAIAATLDARGTDAGGFVTISSTESLDLLGSILVDGTGGDGFGGTTTLQACTLRVLNGAKVSAAGSGTNELLASGQMTINGTLAAGDDGVNRLVYRTTLPLVGPGSAIHPEEDVVQNLALPCCGDECNPPTTSTTSPGTTSTTVVSTTTSTTAPPTTPTTGAPVVSSSTTTTVAASSTSTSMSSTAPPASTTSTTLGPTSCLDEPLAGFDAMDCYLSVLSEILRTQPAEALGGAKSARSLASRIAQAQRLTTQARSKPKPTPTLRRAKQPLKGFRGLTQRGQRRRRIASDVGGRLLELSGQALSTLDQIRDQLRTSRPPG